MILTGRRLNAEQARELGFVNRLTEGGKALEGARQLAEEILEASPVAVRCALEAMNDAEQFASTTEALLHRSPALDRLLWTEDAIEGPLAFAGRRKPLWKGR
jgi:acetyl-CoA C-acetyltransferase